MCCVLRAYKMTVCSGLVSVVSNNPKSGILLMEGHQVREQTVSGSI